MSGVVLSEKATQFYEQLYPQASEKQARVGCGSSAISME